MRISSAPPIPPVSKGSCGCVRCPTMASTASTIRSGDVGVVVEAEQDRHVGAEDLAAERGLLALDIVEANGRAGAVQLQVQPVEPARRRVRPLADDIQEIGAGTHRRCGRPATA